MSKLDVNTRSFLLVAAMARSLAHTLRTPLSVISNDLYYFQSLLPASECTRTIERCKQISALLSQPASFGAPELRSEPVAVAQLLKKAFPEVVVTGADASITGDQCRLERAFEVYAQSLSSFGNTAQARIELAASSAVVTATVCMPRLQAQSDLRGSFNSLTELFAIVLKADNLTAPLADAVFWAHAAAIELKFEEEISFRVSFSKE